MKYFIIHSILFLVLLVGSLQAQEVTLKSAVSKSEIHIGDKIEYRITVSHPDSSHIELPGVIGNLGTFEVREHQVSEAVSQNGLTTQSWILTLSTFLSGEYVIPPQLVEFYPKNDTARVKLYTEPITIKVLTLNSDDVTDIIEVEGVASLPMALEYLLAIIGGSLLLLGSILYFVFRKKRMNSQLRTLPPYEEAKKNLETLKQRNLMETGAYKDHFFELTEILKLYISRRFNVEATEATSAELLERITVISEIEGALKESLPSFCEQTDLIKFAKMTLDSEKNEMLNEYVEEFVEKTKPEEKAHASKTESIDKGEG